MMMLFPRIIYVQRSSSITLYCITVNPRGMRCSEERSSTVSSKTTFIKGSKPRRTPVTLLLAFNCKSNRLSMYLQQASRNFLDSGAKVLFQVWNIHTGAHSYSMASPDPSPVFLEKTCLYTTQHKRTRHDTTSVIPRLSHYK